MKLLVQSFLTAENIGRNNKILLRLKLVQLKKNTADYSQFIEKFKFQNKTTFNPDIFVIVAFKILPTSLN